MNFENVKLEDIVIEDMSFEEIIELDEELDRRRQKRDEMFCENIKNIRAMLGLTKRKMSEMCKISVYMLNLLEKGIVPERITTIVFEGLEESWGLSPWDVSGTDACELIKKNKKNMQVK